MKIQQRSWASRMAEANEDYPFEEPDFAPDPTDPELLAEIREAAARNMMDLICDLEDEDLDDFGNPIVHNEQPTWAQRLEKASLSEPPDDAVRALLKQPFSSVLLGAALCSGQPYLLWNISHFLNVGLSGNSAWLHYGCGALLNRMRGPTGLVIQDKTTVDVLFNLLIEPFALMNSL